METIETVSFDQFFKRLGKEDHFHIGDSLEILSTIRYDPLLTKVKPSTIDDVKSDNFFLLPEHVERTKYSVAFFLKHMRIEGESPKEFIIEKEVILNQLLRSMREAKVSVDQPLKIRLLVSLPDGNVTLELYETELRKNLLDGLEDDYPQDKRFDLYVDRTPVLVSPFTSFKTTKRTVYNEARKRALPGKSPREEVILINTASEVMEGSITNIAIKSKQGIWVTPKLTSGCLCGVTRHLLLKRNFIKEADISVDMLKEGHDVLLMNGIMGCIRGTIRGFVAASS